MPSRLVTCSVLASRTAPAWEMIPDPSADTVILGRREVFFTGKVPSARCGQDLRQALFFQLKALFHLKDTPGLIPRESPRLARYMRDEAG